MKIIKNIIFPMHFTHYSISILEYAILFARSLRARLHLLHVITQDESHSFDALNEFFLAVQEGEGNAASRSLLSQVDLVKVQIKAADAWSGILRYADENRADLIMMAVPGSASSDASLGQTTHQVLRQSHCPVMVIRLPDEKSEHRSRFELTLQEMKKEIAAHHD